MILEIFKTFFPNTRCHINDEMRAFLWKILGNKPLKITNRLYSGSNDGWDWKDFHNRCDKKGKTVSLFQIKDGDCIGGYTSQNWESPNSEKYKADSSAFLFNLTRSRHFPSQATRKNIKCFRNQGPSFSGGAISDLTARGLPFNGISKCWSYANNYGYKIPLLGEINQLTNQKDGEFTISQLEVWLVEEE